MKTGCWLGLVLVTGSLHAQGISAVTRPTLMAGPPLGGLAGTMPATLPGGGGGAGLAVNPNWAGAAAMFAPLRVPSTGLNPANPAVAGPGLAARPVVSRVSPAAPVDPAELDARVLAFQQEQARQGSPSAQLALGRRYLAGDGLERNEAVGRVWLEAAARQGSAEAQDALRQLASPGVKAPAGSAGKD